MVAACFGARIGRRATGTDAWVPAYNQERGRWAGVDREDLANAAKRSFDGVPVGLYREGDDHIPIMFRDIEALRRGAASDMDRVQILPTLSTESVPLSQVTDGIAVEWEDPGIHAGSNAGC